MANDADELVSLLLTERMVHTGWKPHGRSNASGSCRLMSTVDGEWVAINLARPRDVEILDLVLYPTPTVPRRAALDRSGPDWPAVERAVSTWRAADLVAAVHDLGVPVGRVGEVRWTGSLHELPVRVRRVPTSGAPREQRPAMRVLDLSSLWAGPLCSRLLLDAGCAVTTVESTRRPDPTRLSHPALHAQLHQGKHHVRLDFENERERLMRMIAAADIVIEASRPRALRHLGIHSEQLLGASGPSIWVSITGFGGDGDRDSLRVGFGDDCAAAGGLVDWSGDGPRFLGDAVADPVTGLVSASAVLDQVFERESLAAPSGCHIRVALAECANWVFCGGRLGDDRRD